MNKTLLIRRAYYCTVFISSLLGVSSANASYKHCSELSCNSPAQTCNYTPEQCNAATSEKSPGGNCQATGMTTSTTTDGDSITYFSCVNTPNN